MSSWFWIPIWKRILSSPSLKSSPPRPNPNSKFKAVQNPEVQLGLRMTLKSHGPPPSHPITLRGSVWGDYRISPWAWHCWTSSLVCCFSRLSWFSFLHCSTKSFSSFLTSSSWIYLKILLETPGCICFEFWACSSDPWTGLWPSSRREARRASSRILKFFIKELLLNLIWASLVFLWIKYMYVDKKYIVNENCR